MNGLTLPPTRVPIADVPDLAAAVRALGLMTDEDAARLVAIEQARYVLVKMDQGEYWRCGRCGGKHTVPDIGPVFTAFCTPRPWRGLQQALYAYLTTFGAKLSDLSPEQKQTVEALSKTLPNLAASHPDAARRLATPASDIEYVGWVLGSVVEISPADARHYAGRINARAGRTVIRM